MSPIVYVNVCKNRRGTVRVAVACRLSHLGALGMHREGWSLTSVSMNKIKQTPTYGAKTMNQSTKTCSLPETPAVSRAPMLKCPRNKHGYSLFWSLRLTSFLHNNCAVTKGGVWIIRGVPFSLYLFTKRLIFLDIKCVHMSTLVFLEGGEELLVPLPHTI